MPRLLARAVMLCLPLLCSAALVATAAPAQSSLADAGVAPRGSSWARVDYLRVPSGPDSPAWSLYTARNTFGVGHGLELTAGATWLPGDIIQPLAATPGMKWRFLDQKTAGVSAAVGGAAFISLGAQGTLGKPWGIAFGVVERSLGQRAPTVAAGAYTLVRKRQPSESRAGLMMSVAQPVTPALALSVVWVGGNNAFGYLSPGAAFFHDVYSLWLGYSRGTTPRGNSGPALSMGIEL